MVFRKRFLPYEMDRILCAWPVCMVSILIVGRNFLKANLQKKKSFSDRHLCSFLLRSQFRRHLFQCNCQLLDLWGNLIFWPRHICSIYTFPSGRQVNPRSGQEQLCVTCPLGKCSRTLMSDVAQKKSSFTPNK